MAKNGLIHVSYILIIGFFQTFDMVWISNFQCRHLTRFDTYLFIFEPNSILKSVKKLYMKLSDHIKFH